ncbi:hypothetical protein RA210_U550002 [Rubrivivax sp. A210]|nr:hypothetical protein RA210_U550002 [Rubrivivax sp. A210]
MTRPAPTAAETEASAALAAAFRREGHQVLFPERERSDRPDLLFEINGIRIACECIQIPPKYIYSFHHKHFRDSDWRGNQLLSTLWPNEPHQWAAEAVRKKNALIPQYVRSTGAREVWLLLHSPPQSNQFFVNAANTWIPWALRHGANSTPHAFAQIHLWTPQTGITPISIRGNETNIRTELAVDLSSGYPTMCVTRFALPFVTASAGSTEPVIHTFRHETSTAIVVPPRDPKYRKLSPARRVATYQSELVAWEDRAELSTILTFQDSGEIFRFEVIKLQGFSPAQQYYCHNLHEYVVPHNLRTFHWSGPSAGVSTMDPRSEGMTWIEL